MIAGHCLIDDQYRRGHSRLTVPAAHRCLAISPTNVASRSSSSSLSLSGKNLQMSNLFLFLQFLVFLPIAASLQLDLLTTTVEELSFHLASGHITSAHLVEQYLAQIEAHNEKGLGLRAVIEVAPKRQVLDIAARLDYERRLGRSRGPLHGIPVLVKVCRVLLWWVFFFVGWGVYGHGNDYRIISRHIWSWV